MAKAIYLADITGPRGLKGDKGDVGSVNPIIDRRLDAMEEVATQAGTRLENTIIDPKPLTTLGRWIGGNVTLQQAPGYGRAIAAGGAATSIYSMASLDADDSAKAYVDPGERVSTRIEIRAMPTQRMSATVNLRGWKWNGASFESPVTLATTGQLHIDPDAVLLFETAGVVPTDGSVTHVDLLFTFRRYAETYPLAGDFVYFRNAALYSGPNAVLPVEYVDGDSANAFWVGSPNASASIRLVPREGGSGGADGNDPGLQRSTIVDAGIKKRGGRIGTGGLPAVALRFDHHFQQFNDKVIPLLRKYRLPWGQMANIGNFGKGNDTLTVAQVRDLCYTSGGELYNHSWSHSNITSEAEADREVTKGLADLKSAFPGLWIDGWAGPGQTQLMGMEGSDTPEKFYGTVPGRLILQQHAFVRGYYPGVYQRLSMPNMVGGPHTTIDALDYTYVEGLIRGAVNVKGGLTMMLHPNYLDTVGYMTTATLDQILAYIAARRDAGELVVLSTTGILLADSSTADRWNLLVNGAAGSMAGGWSETVSSRSALNQYGVPHEAVAKVTATTAADFTLSVAITHDDPALSFTEAHIVTLEAGQSAVLRVPVTPPLKTTSTVISLTGNGTHTGVSYWAV